MVEVFKTDVDDENLAQSLIELIHSRFPSCRANFALDDCDRILRVFCSADNLDAKSIISLLGERGAQASILEDVVIPLTKLG